MVLTEENGRFPTAMADVEPNAPRVAISTSGTEANCTANDGMDPARFYDLAVWQDDDLALPGCAGSGLVCKRFLRLL